MNTRYILIGIAVSAVVTFALRALPFVIFNGKRQMPEMLVKLGRVLPATIMAVLIVYCLKGAVSAPVATGIPSLVGVLVTGGTYKWKHNTLLSILLGTASYMIMLRIM
ncbi:MAG TPA: branched-chain amino acid permease [Coprococcus sp.]|jgi:branched-subunit amino acid transport protein AzlD|nr:branched-chain amino acid permease [Coprococcus sp.]